MRHSGLGRSRRSGQVGEVMGIAATDVFATLFLLMLVVGLKAADLPLAADRADEPATPPVNVFVAPTFVRVGDEGPIGVEHLAGRLRALGDKPAVRIHVDHTVGIEREHAVLAAAMAAGAGSVSLSISGGEVR